MILAAGEATRMGAAKPALPFEKSSMVGAVIDTTKASDLDPVIVVTGYHHDTVSAAVGESALVVHNANAASGNVSSLVVGLDAARDVDAVIVLLSDMPLVTRVVVKGLAEGFLASGRAFGWTQYRNGRGHPIAIAAHGFAAIQDLSGSKALWPFLDALDPDDTYELVVPTDIPADVNTPDDYDTLTTPKTK